MDRKVLLEARHEVRQPDHLFDEAADDPNRVYVTAHLRNLMKRPPPGHRGLPVPRLQSTRTSSAIRRPEPELGQHLEGIRPLTVWWHVLFVVERGLLEQLSQIGIEVRVHPKTVIPDPVRWTCLPAQYRACGMRVRPLLRCQGMIAICGFHLLQGMSAGAPTATTFGAAIGGA